MNGSRDKSSGPVEWVFPSTINLQPSTSPPAAASLAGANAEWHGDDCAEDGGERIEPELLEIPIDDGGCERAGWVHRSTANGTGEHGFQGDHCADGDASSDALFLSSSRDA